MILRKVNKCEITIAPTPDHRGVITEINIGNNQRGKGYWKLNSSVIQEQGYQTLINQLIEQTINEYHNEIDDWELWELLIIRIKETSSRYSVMNVRQKQNKIQKIEKEIYDLDKLIGNCGDVEQCMILTQERKQKKYELDDLYAQNTLGCQIRAKAKWVEDGEKNTAYFLSLEKKHQSSNTIKKLSYKDKTASDDQGILGICHDFYKDLYKDQKVSDNYVNNHLNSVEFNKILTEDEKGICEGKITIIECEKAVYKMKGRKSPGLDGLTVEFYHQFWPVLKDVIVRAFNNSYDLGSLPESLRLAVISLIFKKGDTENLENYRPISLTNVDYKILTTCLANRIQKVINKLIDPDQIAYIKGRFIGTNVRLVQDVIENCQEGILFFSDFKKAFDSLSWNFIFKCLKRYNFGESMLKWLKILYVNPVAIVKNNGYFSEQFDIERGLRQGCCVSCLIFILCVEVLANKIRDNPNIKGIKLHTKSVKLCQYADDATFFLKDENDLQLCIKDISDFGFVSGMQLNKKKCEGLFIGRLKDRQHNCTLAGINWPLSPIRCLGIYVGNDKSECDRLNWVKRIGNLEQLLNIWKQRHLTLFGKVQIIKSLALSKLTYVASCCTMPNDETIKYINNIFYKFIWGKVERIKRKSIINKTTLGGLGMIDIKAYFLAVKAAWVPRLLKGRGENWTEIPLKFINRLGRGEYILRTFIHSSKLCPLIKTLPEFYSQMVTSFNRAKVNYCMNKNIGLLAQPLFGNHNVTILSNGRETIPYFTNWINSGYECIGNLKVRNGKLDVNYINEHLVLKHNMLAEVNIMQKALQPYKNELACIEPNDIKCAIFHDKEGTIDITKAKSNFFYTYIIKSELLEPNCQAYWQTFFNKEIDFYNVYLHKLVKISDIKIAETNFKILNNILPCNENLEKWKKKCCSKCSLCGEQENIPHLIFECKLIRPLWRYVSNALRINISLEDVILGTQNHKQNDIITLNTCISVIVFIIYRNWLEYSLSERQRDRSCIFRDFKSQILYYKAIYEKTGSLITISRKLQEIYCMLTRV